MGWVGQIDWAMTLAGFGVGIVVGLTGMGGGALMTPVLVLFFQVPPLAAVSSDLVASAIMKPVGSVVHIARRTVDWRLVGWLCAGSVPSAFCGVLLARGVSGDGVQRFIQDAMGIALLVAVAGMLARVLVGRFRARPDESTPGRLAVHGLATLLVGAVGGLLVGLTSVGSGSLIVVALLLMYPALRTADLVGTDLVQAVPLVAAAALGHLLFGDFRLDVTGPLLLGSIPGVFLGAQVSARTRGGWVRAVLALILLASALKLLGVPGTALLVTVVVATAGTLAGALWWRRGRAQSGATAQTGATARTGEPAAAGSPARPSAADRPHTADRPPRPGQDPGGRPAAEIGQPARARARF